MILIDQNCTDPYFNIASEEYLLKNFSDDVFMLYQNSPSLIVGKHQNVFSEINYWYTRDHQIDVVRRLSGGGTVFHDEGNLNFTFIRYGSEGNLIDFKRFTEPILQVLWQLNVPAERSGRNDLLIHGLKFSGNAEHVYKNRTLHHGTLLFSSKLNSLKEALKVDLSQYEDKAVKSVRSKVTNIIEHLPNPMTLEAFRENILQHVKTTFPEVNSYQFSKEDQAFIQQLKSEKYSTWEWDYGYSPKFLAHKSGTLAHKPLLAEFEIDKGFILSASIKWDQKSMPLLEDELIRLKYQEDALMIPLNRFFSSTEALDFLRIIL